MELKIQTLHFDATDKLASFIEKKMEKLEKKYTAIVRAEVTLKVVKPETAMNKETQIHVVVAGKEFHAEKVCDTFEEGIDACVEVLERSLQKHKETHK